MNKVDGGHNCMVGRKVEDIKIRHFSVPIQNLNILIKRVQLRYRKKWKKLYFQQISLIEGRINPAQKDQPQNKAREGEH